MCMFKRVCIRESFDNISLSSFHRYNLSFSRASLISPLPLSRFSSSFSFSFARATILVRFASSFSYSFRTPGRSPSIPFSSPTHERLPLLLPSPPPFPVISLSLVSTPLHPLVPSLMATWQRTRTRIHGGVASGRSVSRGFGFDTFEREERARFAHRVESRRSFPNAIPEICRRNLAQSTGGIRHANSRS